MAEKCVLVVESDPTTQKTLENMWFERGCRVRIIGSGAIALDYLKRGERFDTVVIGTPFGITGTQLLEAMLSHETLRGTMFIIRYKPSP